MISHSLPAALPPTLAPNYDTPWKIAIEKYFEQFMAFYFPKAHAEIDWRVPHEFLDQELQAIAKRALVGKRHVDKLVKVRRCSGRDEWLYIHMEVQATRQAQFAERMFIYNYRIFDRYHHPVVSMALLCDASPRWKPQEFAYAAMDCEMTFRFPVAKLTEFAHHEATLAEGINPFALLTLAWLQNRAARHDMNARFAVKCRVIRMLYKRQWTQDMIRVFFLVIDWMMVLPPEQAMQLTQFVSELEKEQEMEYVSSVERILLEQKRQEGVLQGMQQGMQQGESVMLCRLLARRFGVLPPSMRVRINTAAQAEIELWFDRAFDAASLEEVFQDVAH
jgi:hypothetical protein